MADYGGMRPTFTYSKEDDPKIQAYDRALAALQAFGGFMHQMNAPEEARKDKILSAEITQIQNLGLNVDIDEYFKNENYRQQMKNKEEARRNVATKAANYIPDQNFQVLSPILLSFKTVYDTDISPAVFSGADLTVAKKILIDGDEDINEPAIMNLSWEDINAFPGMSDELIRLGLLQEGEATAEGWEEARHQLPERFDWFSIALREGTPAMGLSDNENFASTQTEIDQIVTKKIDLAQKQLNAVKDSPEYADYINAGERWDGEKANSIGYVITEDKEVLALGEEYGQFGVQMEWEEFTKKYPHTAKAYGMSFDYLAELATSDNPAVQQQWQVLEEFLKEESNERNDTFYANLKRRINDYTIGLSKYRQINSNLELQAFTSMELTEQANKNMRDIESINDVITPIGQHAAYLTAILEGLLPIDQIESKYLNEDNTININAVNQDMDRTSRSFEEYSQHIASLYNAQETNFSPVHLNAQFELAMQKASKVIIQSEQEKKLEKQNNDREAYMDALRELEYNNLWRKNK